MEDYKVKVGTTALYLQADYARINCDFSLDFLLFLGSDKTVLSLSPGEWGALARVRCPCVSQARETSGSAQKQIGINGIQPSA